MKKGKIYVYKILNLVNGKFYIGSTTQELTNKRFADHKTTLRGDCHANNHLQYAWNKYGEENFKFEIVEYCDTKEGVLAREQYYLDTLLEAQEYIEGKDSIFLKKGYNLTPTAGATYGWKASEEQKLVNSERTKELWSSDEYREKQMKIRSSKEYFDKRSNSMKELYMETDIRGKVGNATRERVLDKEYLDRWKKAIFAPEVLAKRSKSMKAKWKDEEYLAKMKEKCENQAPIHSELMKEKWDESSDYYKKQMKIRSSEENRKKQSDGLKAYYDRIGKAGNPLNKKVGLFDPTTDELAREYASAKLAAKAFNLTGVKYFINKAPKAYRGFVWKYI